MDGPAACLGIPKLYSVCSWKLLIYGLAARAVLTYPAALSLVAHVLASETPTHQASAPARPATSLRHVLRNLRLFSGPSLRPSCALC